MTAAPFDRLASDNVRLELHLQTHDRNTFIYLGDPALRAEVQAAPLRLSASVVTYNCGLDWVSARIGAAPAAEQWRRLRGMLETPVLPLRTKEASC